MIKLKKVNIVISINIIRLSYKLATVFFLIVTLFSKNGQAQDFDITGRVVNENGVAISIPFISIKSQPDTNAFNVKLNVAIDGHFQTKVKPGKYLITINDLNHEAWQSVLDIYSSVNLNTIRLTAKVNMLKEVEIRKVQKYILRQSDRLIFKVEDNPLANGKDALQIFSLIPSVWVDHSGGISINGNTGSKVMVNGKLMRLSSEQLKSFLATVRADEIGKIEVMAHPPAEYDAEGSSGLINIILRKKKSDGLAGSLGAGISHGKYTSFLTNALLNYKKEALLFYGSYNFSNSKDYTRIFDERFQGSTTYNSQSTIKPRGINNRFNFGAGYEINKNQSLGLEFSGSFNNQNSNTISESLMYRRDIEVTQLVQGNFNSEVTNKFYNLSLNYKIAVDTIGSNFKILADYIHSQNNGNGSFISKYYNDSMTSLKDSLYRNQIPNVTKNTSIALDYTHIASKRTNFTFGGKFTTTDTNNEIAYQSFDGKDYISVIDQSNKFHYLERILAGYFKINFTIFNAEATLGLRGEYTNSKGESITLLTQNNTEYLNLFPSLFIKKDLSAKTGNYLSFYVGRRLNRPSFADLNPFVLRVDDYTSVTGNSNLLPQFTNALEVSYTFHDKYSISAFHNRTTDVFAQVLLSNYENGLSAIYQRQNLDVLNNYGLSIYAPIEILKWWTMSNSALFYRNDYKFGQNNNNRATYLIKSYQSLDLFYGITLQALGTYKSKSSQGNLTFKETYAIDFAIQKSIIKNKIKLDFTVNDIFNTSRADYVSNYDGFYLNEKQKYQTRMYTLKASYNFLSGKKFKTQRTQSGNQEEKSRIGY